MYTLKFRPLGLPPLAMNTHYKPRQSNDILPFLILAVIFSMVAKNIKRKIQTQKRKKTASSMGTGWLTTDAEELERRQLRAQEEALLVQKIQRTSSIYFDYDVISKNETVYQVEYRDRLQRINSCNCPDFQINQLGTCKHIEKVALHLKNKKSPDKRTCTEIFLHPIDAQIQVLWADDLRKNDKVKTLLQPYFSSNLNFKRPTLKRFLALEKQVKEARIANSRLRISKRILPWLEGITRKEQAKRSKHQYLTSVDQGKRTNTIVNLPLYDYQREGMMHLAFNQRAILADEMGLGKTVQAIAACELLRQLNDVKRVLVICPVSLKTEWEEQIQKFTSLSCKLIQGNRAERLQQYQKPSFFNLANYEQLLYDHNEIQQQLAPDIIILDEAQRVKNWQTKTAQATKKLTSQFMFVLSGTPLENRIDEIYSIAQLVDPAILGPLFRFNRDFYQLDEKGRPQGYKNLDQLHQRLQPILLRRRKRDVEGELPERLTNTYFVPMAKEQRLRYEEFEKKVARLIHKAQKMPLTPEEYKLLQAWLACMRMLCDSPYILDQSCRVSPKLAELKSILEEQLTGTDNKVIIFSEWTKMLDLVQKHLSDVGIEYALHTGQVAQKKRRAEINRFKTSSACRVFLSSDAGATGLNLQIANVVINLDLPWNPAKLEQRIARAWRKHQTRRVNVINLVTEHSIEHRMLAILQHKTLLADGVLEGSGEAEMDIPSGRKVMVERLQQLIGMSTTQSPKPEKRSSLDMQAALYKEIGSGQPNLVTHFSSYPNNYGEHTLFAVVNDKHTSTEQFEYLVHNQYQELTGSMQVISESTMATIQQLVDAGILQLNKPTQNWLNFADRTTEDPVNSQWLSSAREQLKDAQRQANMAKLLFSGEFVLEAKVPILRALEIALNSYLTYKNGLAADSLKLDSLDAEAFKLILSGQELEQLLNGLYDMQSSLAETELQTALRIINRVSQFIA